MKLRATLLVLICLGACRSEAAHVVFDVTATGPLDSNVAARVSTTAYLIDDYDQAGILDQFLEDFEGRVGFVLLDIADEELHALAPPPDTVTDLAARLEAIDTIVTKIVGAGGTAVLGFKCAMPDFLSSREGKDHSVLSGLPEAAAATVSGCSPPKSQAAARDDWHDIMQAVAAHFAEYNGGVVYMFGSEPENYFAGTAAEMFDTYGLAIQGILAGDASARIGGITPVVGAAEMSKATANFDGSTHGGEGSFTYVAEELDSPLMDLWIDYAGANGLPLDFITFHIWNPSSRPRSGGVLEDVRSAIDSAMSSAGLNGPSIVLPTDFAGWENTCLVAPDGQLQSYYDSEYLGAMFVDHAIAALRQSEQDIAVGGSLAGIHPVYGYLMELTTYAPCMPAVGGSNGFPGMVTGTGVPKPSYNALRLFAGLSGKIGFPSSDDPSVEVVAAHRSAGGARVSMVLSRHLPSELHYTAEGGGFPGYKRGSLFSHRHGFDLPLLSDETPSALYLSYAAQPDHPMGLVQDLLAQPAVIDVADLGLSPARTNYLAAVRSQGLLQRLEASFDSPVQIDIDNLAPGPHRLVTMVVDTTHGNPYRARHLIQDQIDAANGDPAALDAVLQHVLDTYGFDSMLVDDQFVDVVDGTATVTITMEPNSVWLVVMTAVVPVPGPGFLLAPFMLFVGVRACGMKRPRD